MATLGCTYIYKTTYFKLIIFPTGSATFFIKKLKKNANPIDYQDSIHSKHNITKNYLFK